MTKSTMKVVKGVAAGAATGMVIGYMGKNMPVSKRDIKKKADKAIEAAGEVMNAVSYMFK